MFKKKEEARKTLDNVKPLTLKDFPDMNVRNVKVVSDHKVTFSLNFMDGLAIHGMQLVEKKDETDEDKKYFIAPPQSSYKVKEGFYKNRNEAFVYMDNDFTHAVINAVLDGVELSE